MQHQKVIEQLGYSPQEAKVYLASLKFGEAKISELVSLVKLPRSSVQLILNKLRQDGLMNSYTLGRYKFWAPAKPELLLDNLRIKENLVIESMQYLNTLWAAGRNKGQKRYPSEKLMETFHFCIGGSNQPILITNSSNEIEYVNAPWQKLFGYTLNDVHGENPNILATGKTPVTEYKRMWQLLKDDRIFQSDEFIDKKKDGTHINLTTTIFGVNRGNRRFYIQMANENCR